MSIGTHIWRKTPPILIGGLVFIAFLFYFEIGPLSGNTSKVAQTVGTFGPLLFSGFLFWAYVGMTEIKERQTEVQDLQARIMDADNRPILQVDRCEGSGDNILFEMKNIGNGIIIKPAVVAHILLYNESPDEPSEYIGNPPNERNYLRAEDGTKAYITANEGQKIEAVTQVYMTSDNSSDLDRTFSEVLETIRDRQSFDQLYYQLEISYEHLMEGENSERGRLFLEPKREELDDRFSKFTKSNQYFFKDPDTYYGDNYLS